MTSLISNAHAHNSSGSGNVCQQDVVQKSGLVGEAGTGVSQSPPSLRKDRISAEREQPDARNGMRVMAVPSTTDSTFGSQQKFLRAVCSILSWLYYLLLQVAEALNPWQRVKEAVHSSSWNC